MHCAILNFLTDPLKKEKEPGKINFYNILHPIYPKYNFNPYATQCKNNWNILHSTFCTKASKPGLYLTPIAHFSLDDPHFWCSVAMLG